MTDYTNIFSYLLYILIAVYIIRTNYINKNKNTKLINFRKLATLIAGINIVNIMITFATGEIAIIVLVQILQLFKTLFVPMWVIFAFNCSKKSYADKILNLLLYMPIAIVYITAMIPIFNVDLFDYITVTDINGIVEIHSSYSGYIYMLVVYVIILTISITLNFIIDIIKKKPYVNFYTYINIIVGLIIINTYLFDVINVVELNVIDKSIHINIIFTLYAVLLIREMEMEKTYSIENLVIQHMDQPFMLLDKNKMITSFNHAAGRVFPVIKYDNSRSYHISEIMNMSADFNEDFTQVSFRNLSDEGFQDFQANVSRVQVGDKVHGYGIVIYDRTEENKLLDDLERLATIDNLTEIYNRKTFFDKSTEIISLCAREQKNYAALMLDLDNFKRINDTYSHQAGDKVLKEVAKTIKKNLRNYDVFGRYGGEEFSVVVINITEGTLRSIADKLNEVVRDLYIVWEGEHIPITVSIGACFVKDYGPDYDLQKILYFADEALYDSKHKGKDTYTIVHASEKVNQLKNEEDKADNNKSI